MFTITRPTARLLRPGLAITTLPRIAPARALSYPHFRAPTRTGSPYPARTPQYVSEDKTHQFGAAIVDTRNGVGELLHQVGLLNVTIREMKRNFTILAVMCTAGAVTIGALVGVILWVMVVGDGDGDEDEEG